MRGTSSWFGALSALSFLFAHAARAESAGEPEGATTPPPSAPEAAVPKTSGEAPQQEVTLPQLLDLLRQRSPRAAASRSQVAVAGADVVAAGAYPNPNLSYGLLAGIHEPGYVNGTQHQVTLEQPILIAGQRGARRAVADLGVAAARAHADADREELAQKGRTLFVALLAAQERVQVLEEAEADILRARHVVEGRAQSGMMSQYDSIRIQVEAQTLAARSSAARTDRADASGHLATLVGLNGFAPRAAGNLASLAGTRVASTTVTDPARLPRVLAASKESDGAVARIDAAQRERWPTPVIGVGAQFTTDGYTLAANVGVALDLPLFDRGQGPIARAEAEAELAQHSREVALAEAQTELARARSSLALRRRTLDSFEQGVMARLPELRRMAEIAYTNGRGSILDLLDALRTITETRLSELDQLEAAAVAHIDLLAAEGRADTPEDTPAIGAAP